MDLPYGTFRPDRGVCCLEGRIAMTFTHIETLRGLVLPETSPLRRDHTRPEPERNADYLRLYDDRTLIYDAVRRADGSGVILTAPPFYNLWAPFRDGLRCDTRMPKLRRWSHGQADLVELRGPTQRLRLSLAGQDHAIPIRDSIAPQFAGLNALFLLNKDNQLDWIRAWLDYYIRAHGLEAIVIFDNGSTAYTAEDLMDTLTACGRLKAAAIYRAPFPFGCPYKSKHDRVGPMFLQTALLNLARVDVLSQARAVLNIDADEIIRCDNGRSIFDMAAARPNRMVKVHGSWIFPAPGSALPVGHGAHTYRTDPPTRCNQKWCAVPRGLLSRFGWGVHHVGGRLVKLIYATSEARMIHCRGTSTAWKAKRFDLPENLVEDPELKEFMAQWFPQ